MRRREVLLDDDPLLFETHPSITPELRRKAFHARAHDDWEFRSLIDLPDALDEAWTRTSRRRASRRGRDSSAHSAWRR